MRQCSRRFLYLLTCFAIAVTLDGFRAIFIQDAAAQVVAIRGERAMTTS
jgi:hypothetical protein